MAMQGPPSLLCEHTRTHTHTYTHSVTQWAVKPIGRLAKVPRARRQAQACPRATPSPPASSYRPVCFTHFVGVVLVLVGGGGVWGGASSREEERGSPEGQPLFPEAWAYRRGTKGRGGTPETRWNFVFCVNFFDRLTQVTQ